VRRIAEQSRCKISKNIIDPGSIRKNISTVWWRYVQEKGMDEVKAREKLMDPNYLGTMMLENGDADGLVSGAGHTTAMTLTPPLQIIKTAPGVSGVSSVFFMLLPDRVLVYGVVRLIPVQMPNSLLILPYNRHKPPEYSVLSREWPISWSTGESGQEVASIKSGKPRVSPDGKAPGW
jgi:phosphate acetyltransferase